MTEYIWAGAVFAVLNGFTWMIVRKKSAALKALFLFTLCLHLAVTLGINFAGFYPFGGGEGDQPLYHTAAKLISEDFRHGVFSGEEIAKDLVSQKISNWYPIILAGLYTVTTAEKIVGLMVSVWLAVMATLLTYLIAYEMTKSVKGALIAGFVAAVYPSYLYFGSLILKDPLVISLMLFGVFCIVKLFRRFSLPWLVCFVFASFLLWHFRFYMAVALLYGFVISWIFFESLHWKKKIIYGMFVLGFLGFLPMYFGYGYYALAVIIEYSAPRKIVLYREFAYIVNDDEIPSYTPSSSLSPVASPLPSSSLSPASPVPSAQVSPKSTTMPSIDSTPSPVVSVTISPTPTLRPMPKNPGSTVIVKAGVDNPITFVLNYLLSFSYVFLGPFPWHLKYARHFFTLVETLPWYVLVFFMFKGIWANKKEWKIMMPVLVISTGILVMLALLIVNFGVYTRIRMPAFFLLLTLLAFTFRDISLNGIYESLRHWRCWIYRILPRR